METNLNNTPENKDVDCVFDSKNEFYKIIQTDKNFELQLLDNTKNIIFSKKHYWKAPNIFEVDKNLFAIKFSVGNPDPNYTIYFDTVSNKVSEEFRNSTYIDDGFIYYFEYNDINSNEKFKGIEGRLIIRDAFSTEKFYKEIHRNFAWHPFYAEIVKEVVFDSEKEVFIVKYLTGNYENNNIVTEEINIR